MSTHQPIPRTTLSSPAIADDVVARPRLIQRLKRHPNRAFTFVCAMAGSGKTTLVRQWLDTESLPVAWLLLGAEHAQLNSFAAAMLASIRSTFPRAMKTLATTERAQSLPGIHQLTAQLINDLSELPERFVLVIEDYHLVQDLAIHEMMVRLLHHPPAQLHLVVTSRTEPPLELHALRAGGQMVEIRQQDIRFQRDEIAEFMRTSLEQALAPDVLDVLVARTDGWAVALRLAVLSVGAGSEIDALAVHLRETHQQTLDYLANEVFSRQSEEMQQFLIRTAILGRLCAPLCNTLLDYGEIRRAEEMLDSLVGSNLVLSPVSSSGYPWYRFHALIRTLLGARLEASVSKEEIRRLHCRAAQWFAAHGFVEEALRHYLAAGSVQSAAVLVEEHLETLLNDLDRAQFSRLLSLLPAEAIEQRCGLVLARSQEIRWLNQLGALPAQMERARQLLVNEPLERQALFQAQIDTYAAFAAWGSAQADRAMRFAQAALAGLPEQSIFMRGLAELMLIFGLQMVGRAEEAMQRVASGLAKHGDLFDAWSMRISIGAWGVPIMEGWLEQAAEAAQFHLIRARKNNMLLGITWGHYGAGLAAFHQGRFALALQHFSSLVEMNYVADGNALLDSVLGQVMTYEWLGKQEMADRCLDEATKLAALSGSLDAANDVATCRARIALVRGDVERALRLLPQPFGAEVRPHACYTVGNPEVTVAHVLICHGSRESLGLAQRLVKSIMALVQEIHGALYEVDAFLLQALLHAKQERFPASNEALKRAVELGGQQGNLRAFVELARPLVPQLRQMLARGEAPHFLQRVLAHFAESDRPTPSSSNALLMPLSNRELDVLELLVQRYSNQEIAEALVVAPNTVRSHLSRLFEKLGAENRRDAVIKAREYGILA